jgi:hypothetical protein
MALGKFKIWSDDKRIVFTSHFGDGAAIVTEGYAGWQVVARPKEIGLTVWQGRNPIAIEIPFLLDYYPLVRRVRKDSAAKDCEEQVTNLERLCGIRTHGQPPICCVDGNTLIPHDYTIYKHHRWVVEQVSWDRQLEIRSPKTGRRLRCGGTITIRQYVEASVILRRISSRARATPPRYHTIKRGDTLHKLAMKYYGDSNKWKLIADVNHMRDPRSLKIGKKVRLP